MSPRTGLALARTSTLVPMRGLLDDTYTTGRLAKTTKGVKLKSLSPLISQHIWDEYISLCPFLAFIRYSYNPIVASTGSFGLKMRYAESPKFLFCVFVEWINYEYLMPFGLNVHTFDNFCRREIKQTWFVPLHSGDKVFLDLFRLSLLFLFWRAPEKLMFTTLI